MKKWKYVSGISSACIGLYMIFRLFLAELSENKKGNIISLCMNVIATYVLFF